MRRFSLLFLICLIFSGCYDIVLEEENDGYETIDGIWHVNIFLAEQTCNPDHEPSDSDTILFVTVQDWTDDGGYVVDFVISERRLYWYDIEVDACGDFLFENNLVNLIDRFGGNIRPGRIDAFFGLEVVNSCNVSYDLRGYQPYDHNPPPEGFER